MRSQQDGQVLSYVNDQIRRRYQKSIPRSFGGLIFRWIGFERARLLGAGGTQEPCPDQAAARFRIQSPRHCSKHFDYVAQGRMINTRLRFHA